MVQRGLATGPAESGLSLVCFHSLAEARPWHRELDELNLCSARPDPFSTFDFLEHYHEYDEEYPGGTGYTLWLLVVFRDDVPVGYLPLKHLEGQFLGLPVSKLTFLVLHDTDRPHLVARCEDELEVAAACLAWLQQRVDQWDLLEFHQQDRNSPLAALAPHWSRRQYRLASWECHENATIRMRWPTLAEYYAELSANLRSTLARQTRRLTETGRTEVVSTRDPACLPALFELYLDLESRSWKARAGAGVTRSALREDYMRALLANPRILGIDLKILLLDGQPISGIMTGTFAGNRYLLQLAYDASLARLGPGSPMLALCMRDSILEGNREFNLLNGFATYKSRWLADVTPTRVMQVYRRGRMPDWRRRCGDFARSVRDVAEQQWSRLARRANRTSIPSRANPSRWEVEQSAAEGVTVPAWTPPSPERQQEVEALLSRAARAGRMERLATEDWLRFMPGKQFRPG